MVGAVGMDISCASCSDAVQYDYPAVINTKCKRTGAIWGRLTDVEWPGVVRTYERMGYQGRLWGWTDEPADGPEPPVRPHWCPRLGVVQLGLFGEAC